MLNIKQILEATLGRFKNGNESYIVKNHILNSRNINKEDFFIPIVGNNNNIHAYSLNCVKNEKQIII